MIDNVAIRLRDGSIVNGKIWAFEPIPISYDKTGEYKVLIYAILETENGDFLARQLSEIKRDAKLLRR